MPTSSLWRSLTMSAPPILEGVFAINKPPSKSSAQILRDLQSHLTPSSTFRPWIESETLRRDRETHNQKHKRSRRQRQPVQVKLGHGGTLDPLATGVLIVGVGSGTKSLQGFLECTKSYEASMVFGAASDTYDSVGKIVARGSYSHVTEQLVREKLDAFRGRIMQRPPVYSALKVQGKKLYEYAREGKEVPVEIVERPVEVLELEVVEWMEGGTHDYHWPEEEAPKEEKEVVEKVLHLDSAVANSGTEEEAPSELKRKREDEDGNDDAKKAKQDETTTSEPTMSGALPATSSSLSPNTTTTNSKPKCPSPTVRLRMTVTSGFYVRSLCHDLGAAVGSLGLMTSLIRSRQGDFELGKNVLEYEELEQGEEVWGPRITGMLAEWQDRKGT